MVGWKGIRLENGKVGQMVFCSAEELDFGKAAMMGEAMAAWMAAWLVV